MIKPTLSVEWTATLVDTLFQVKVKLEEAQRARRKVMEKTMKTWHPVWFEKKPDPCVPGREVHQYKVNVWRVSCSLMWH